MSTSIPPARPCAQCGKPAEPAFRPFCSKRCADIDLQRWFAGAYAIPAVESDDQIGDEDADPRT